MRSSSRFLCALLVMACTALTSPTRAMAGQMLLGVSGGIAAPMGDFGEVYTGGFHIGLAGDYLPIEQMGLGFDLAVSRNSLRGDIRGDAEAFASAVVGAPVSLEDLTTVLQYGLHARWFPPLAGTPVAPFLEGGVAMYNLREETTASIPGFRETQSTSANKAGLHGGIGLNFKTGSPYRVGIVSMFHRVFTEGSPTTYLTVGLSVAGILGAK